MEEYLVICLEEICVEFSKKADLLIVGIARSMGV